MYGLCKIKLAAKQNVVCYFFEGAEWTGSSKRALFTSFSHATFAIGLMIMSGIAYGIRDWRVLQLVLSGPVVILGVYYWSVMC